MVVPVRSPHTFSNPFDEEAKFFNTYTPSFYINYFKLLSQLAEAGKPMTAEANRKAMAVSIGPFCSNLMSWSRGSEYISFVWTFLLEVMGTKEEERKELREF